MQALLVLAVSVWGLWEGKVIQGLLWSPRVNRCGPYMYTHTPSINGYQRHRPCRTPSTNTTTTHHHTPHHHNTNSTALALAVGSSSLVALLWGYLDIYVGHVKGQKVQYHDVRAVTHGILLGLLVAGFGLTAALWPVHKAASLVYVAMLSYGVLFQIILLVPASVYNPLFLAGYAAFVFYWTR